MLERVSDQPDGFSATDLDRMFQLHLLHAHRRDAFIA